VDSRARVALAGKLLAMGDDELILGHRDSEWTGHAPILEEDIAFANIAVDELGHAKTWYTLLAELSGRDPETYPDELVFFRDAAAYRSAHLVELPKGDWAFSMLRQYVFDAAEMARLPRLAESGYRPLAEAAAKIRKEEVYHYRHTRAWVQRLGQGTEESHSRLQSALDELWRYTPQLFAVLPDEAVLVEAGLVPCVAPDEVYAAWQELALPALREAGLAVPQVSDPLAARREEHSEHLAALLAEMQEVARLERGVEW
jgi:ring-1,2-phenylacetyl-CoA epoxidase subunit PaaC